MTITLNNNNDILSYPLIPSRKPSSQPQEQCNEFVLYSARHNAAVIVSCCNELEFLDLEQQLYQSNVHLQLPLCEKNNDDLPQEEDSFDNYYDDDSSISTYSCVSEELELNDENEEYQNKKVHFADTLVSDVWTRPRTPSEECKVLFYSYEDTQRFRHEYRLERKLQQSNDPATLQKNADKTRSTNSRHSISRVVVLHNNTLETFYDEKDDQKFMPKNVVSNDNEAAIFDNDSFWSGSITWF